MSIIKNAGFKFKTTLASYFTKPSEGIFGYEILSRSSLSFVDHKQNNNNNHTQHSTHAPHFQNALKNKLIMVSTSHVTHPFLFPHYYKGERYDWLKYINEHDTVHRLQFREEVTGKLLTEVDFDYAIPHHSKDLVLLFIEPHKVNEDFLTPALSLANEHELSDFIFHSNQNSNSVSCEGIQITENENDDTNHYDVKFLDVLCNLNTQLKDPNRMFFKSPIRLPMGMCGGSVRIRTNNQTTNKMVGIIEGIVNENTNNNNYILQQKMQDDVVVIPSTVISQFIDETIQKYEFE